MPRYREHLQTEQKTAHGPCDHMSETSYPSHLHPSHSELWGLYLKLNLGVRVCRYYYYEINSPYATNGPHSLSAATTKGDLALVFIAAANDKQVSHADSSCGVMTAYSCHSLALLEVAGQLLYVASHHLLPAFVGRLLIGARTVSARQCCKGKVLIVCVVPCL